MSIHASIFSITRFLGLNIIITSTFGICFILFVFLNLRKQKSFNQLHGEMTQVVGSAGLVTLIIDRARIHGFDNLFRLFHIYLRL